MLLNLAYNSLRAAQGREGPTLTVEVTIDPVKNYRVVVNSFLASGGDSFAVLVDGTDRLGGATDLEALQAYFAAHSPVVPPALDRVALLP